MLMSRRGFLASGVAAAVSLSAAAEEKRRQGMGVVIHSYSIRQGGDKAANLGDPISFLEFCRDRGAGGVQTSLGVRDEDYAGRLRKLCEQHGLFVEASIWLPRSKSDVERFTAEIATARRCGATVARTVLMTGRRYEVFSTPEQFKEFADKGRQSL